MFAASRTWCAGPFAAAILLVFASPHTARAQADGPGAAPLIQQLAAPLSAGDVAVTGFSGAKLATPNLPAGVDPTTLTMIDGDGVALRIFDLSTLGGPTLGQVVVPPVKLTIPARDIGQVFALTFDDGAGASGTGVPNLYTASTSLFGLQIVGAPGADGAPTRLKQGAPGARFMDGQFGALPGANPGAIWKIDGTTGAVTHLADTPANGGPGVGDLAIDRRSRTLYASDLDTGLIRRFNLDAADGADLGPFDHGMSGRPGAQLPSVADDGAKADITSPAFMADDPATWGFTQPERRVSALAVRGGRLYYAVADGPEIWSVALGSDGGFAVTARRELVVKAEKPFAVTDLVFDDQGRMILAQRGTQTSPFDYGTFVEPAAAATLRYAPAPAGGAELWLREPEDYAIGLPDGNRMGSGGIALHRSFNPDGSIGPSCERTLLTTGDDLRNSPALAATIPPGPFAVHGVQINDASLVRPANVPPLQTAFAAYDPNRADPEARGQVGDVEAIPCLGQTGEATPEGLPDLPPAIEGGFAVPPLVFPGDFGPLEPLPSGGGFALAKQALTDTCTQDGGCAFGITLFNPGPDPLPGPIQLDDIFTVGGAEQPEAAIVGAPNSPWECTDGAHVNCLHPGPLPVGETVLTLNFKPGPLGDAKEVRNCVALAGELDDALPPVIEEPEAPEEKDQPVEELRKPTIPPKGGQIGDFKLETKPGQTCTADKGGCAIEVSVTNTGKTPFAGTMSTEVFGKSMTAGKATDEAANRFDKVTVQKADVPPGFICSTTVFEKDGGATGSACENAAVTFQPGETKTFTIAMTPERRALQGKSVDELNAAARIVLADKNSKTSLTGSAGIVVKTPEEQAAEAKKDPKGKGAAGAGPVPNIDDLPPEQCATIAIADPKVAGGGKVDPENPNGGGGGGVEPASKVDGLAIKKEIVKEQPTCSIGTLCKFKITVTNTGAAAKAGPITVVDTFSSAGGNLQAPTDDLALTPNAPWACGKGNPRECTHPGPIPAGQSIDMTIAVKPETGTTGTGVKNCALLKGGAVAACATVPLTQNTPLSQLKFAKVATATRCSDAGGGCSFKISIANPGPGDFTGPLEFDDVLTDDKGAIFAGATLENNVHVTLPQGGAAPISCNKGGAGFVCGTGVVSATIPAGRTIEADVSFKLGGAANPKSVTNCVSVRGDPNKQCATIQTINGPLIRASKISAATTCAPKCTFVVSIKNVGNARATGPFVVDDVFEPASDALDIKAVAGDFFCRKNGGVKLLCTITTKTTLEPGEEVSGAVEVSGANAADKYVNCFDIRTFDGQSPIDAAFPGRCATVIDTAPKTPNLTIIKTAPKADANGVGSCALQGFCTFQIKIVNSGGAAFEGDIIVNDKIADALRLELKGKDGWLCQEPIDNMTSAVCRLPNAKLEPGGVVLLDAAVIPGLKQKNDIIENCATIEIGAEKDSFQDDNKSCAKVKLDPFNVSVDKAGGQGCQPGGDCTFTIKLFNPGPINHNAPVTISDKLDVGPAQIISITPPLPCAAQPTQVPFSCTSPGDVSLPFDGADKIEANARTFTLVVKMPAGAQKFTNCASVSGGTGGVAAPEVSTGPRATGGQDAAAGDGQSARSCVTADLKPQDPGSGGSNPVQPQTDPTPSATSQCFGGMTADAAGRCACPAGTNYNGRICAPSGGVVSPTLPPVVIPCPTGTFGVYPNCTVGSGGSNGVNSAPSCPRGTQGVYPNCRVVAPPQTPSCPRGTTGAFPNCRATPKDPGSGGSNPAQKQYDCARGTTGIYPDCRPIRTERPPCPEGTVGRYPRCRAIQTETPTCPEGTIGRYPRCRPIRTPECPSGTTGAYPNCQAIQTERPRCPDGTTGRYPRCRPIRNEPNPVRECPDGTTGRYPRCYRDRPEPQKPLELRRCLHGQVGTPPDCSCPAGTRFRNDYCRPIGGGGPDNGSTPRPPTPKTCPPGSSPVDGGGCRSDLR